MQRLMNLGGVLILGTILWGGLQYWVSNSYAFSDPVPCDISLSPGNTISQGGILVIRVETAASLEQALTLKTGNKSLPLYKQPSGSYEAVLGISVDDKPGKHLLQITDSSGKILTHSQFTVTDGKFPRQNIQVSKSTKGLQPLPGEMEAIQALKAARSDTRHWSGSFISPTPDCENSPFGVKRYHNGVYTQDYHKGVDLRSPQGRPIKAIANGVVQISEPRFRLHGGTVGLDHGQGLSSIYIHMSKVLVEKGQQVKKGDVIGHVGSTGFATGPHLHWGLYANGTPVNPDQWIRVPRC